MDDLLFVGTHPSRARRVFRSLTTRGDVREYVVPKSAPGLGLFQLHSTPTGNRDDGRVGVGWINALRPRAMSQLAADLASLNKPPKVVAILRSPSLRAFEAFEQERARRPVLAGESLWQYLHSVDAFLDPLELLSAGFYDELLEQLISLPLEVLVLVEEDIDVDPVGQLWTLISFANVAHSWSDELQWLTAHAASLSARTDQVVPDQRTLQRCRALYEESTARLGALLDRDLAHVWTAAEDYRMSLGAQTDA